MPKRPRLLLTQPAQGHIDVAFGDVDDSMPCGMSRIASDIAGALAMADDP